MGGSVLRSPVVTKSLLILAILVGFGFVIYLMSGLPAPREANRARVFSGDFSIIHPPEWEAKVTSSATADHTEAIMITPIKVRGVLQKFFAGRFREPVDVEKRKAAGMTTIPFQGGEALVGSATGKNDFTWTMLFERRGHWYEISLRLLVETDVPNSDWWPYVESFRLSDQPVLPPTTATQPGGAP